MSDCVLVTGASGFVGRVLCKRLQADGSTVIGVTGGAVAVARRSAPEVTEWRKADFSQPESIDWIELLRGSDSVVHLAAMVHDIKRQVPSVEGAYRAINFESTVRLASAAAQVGMKHFVFMSSVKAAGELSENDSPEPATDDSKNGTSAPKDPYGLSKWDAEQALLGLVKSVDLRLVILRPPLVYGPGVSANFARLMRLAQWRIPFPFSAVRNARSLIYVDNLVDAIVRCRSNLAALGQIFSVCDTTLSTTELFFAISNEIGVSPRHCNVPPKILRLLGRLLRREAEFARLLTSMVVDTREIKNKLGWVPPVTFEVGLRATVQWFLNQQQESR
jgi:nucleoside-diphosphate-sugar epimerase